MCWCAFALRWRPCAFSKELCKSFCTHQTLFQGLSGIFVWSLARKTAAHSMPCHVDIGCLLGLYRMLNLKMPSSSSTNLERKRVLCVLSPFTLMLRVFAHFRSHISHSQQCVCKTFWQTDNQLIVIFCRFVFDADYLWFKWHIQHFSYVHFCLTIDFQEVFNVATNMHTAHTHTHSSWVFYGLHKKTIYIILIIVTVKIKAGTWWCHAIRNTVYYTHMNRLRYRNRIPKTKTKTYRINNKITIDWLNFLIMYLFT